MLPQTVIDRQVSRHPCVSLLGVLERHGVGPFAAERLNESLRFAVCSRGVEPGPPRVRWIDLSRYAMWLGGGML